MKHEYIDAVTATGKVMEVQNAMAFNLNTDIGLGAAPQLYQLDEMMLNSGVSYWEGIRNTNVKNEITIINKQFTKVEEYKQVNKVVQHTKQRPIVSFACDDGWNADYYKLKPFSETYGIPFCSSIISGATGNVLTDRMGLELQNVYGWEIMSHGDTHLGPLTNFATENEIEAELKNSKDKLVARGFDIQTISYPYEDSDERVRRLAKKYYNHGLTAGSAINVPPVASFFLKRYAMGSFTSNTAVEYKAKVDLAIAQNGWLIFFLHPANAQHTEIQQGYIEETIQYIISNNVEVMTIKDGYKIFGNTLEAGDYIGGSTGVAISNNGVCKNLTIG